MTGIETRNLIGEYCNPGRCCAAGAAVSSMHCRPAKVMLHQSNVGILRHWFGLRGFGRIRKTAKSAKAQRRKRSALPSLNSH